MTRPLTSRVSVLTIAAAFGCVALAMLVPGWRSALEAQTYYRASQRMTGGGTIGTGGFKHGFELHCNAADLPNHLEINWGKGNYFRLDTLTSASCTDDPSIPNGPSATFDTYDGAGNGVLNGVPATAEFTFTDAGEPGKNDFADVVITDAKGNTVTISGVLKNGNQQAHGG